MNSIISQKIKKIKDSIAFVFSSFAFGSLDWRRTTMVRMLIKFEYFFLPRDFQSSLGHYLGTFRYGSTLETAVADQRWNLNVVPNALSILIMDQTWSDVSLSLFHPLFLSPFSFLAVDETNSIKQDVRFLHLTKINRKRV